MSYTLVMGAALAAIAGIVNAADTAVVHVTGQIVTPGCRWKQDQLTVELPPVRASKFTEVGQLVEARKRFELTLTGCPLTIGAVKTKWEHLVPRSGTASTICSAPSADANAAQGVCITIDGIPWETVYGVTAVTMVLPYQVYYQSTSDIVTPGKVTAAIKFTLLYP